MTARKFIVTDEIRELRAGGMSIREIAEIYGVGETTVSDALSGVKRIRDQSGRYKPRREVCHGAGPDYAFIVRWTKRPVRQLIDAAAIRRILDERRGGIPIAELLAVIGKDTEA